MAVGVGVDLPAEGVAVGVPGDAQPRHAMAVLVVGCGQRPRVVGVAYVASHQSMHSTTNTERPSP